MTDKSSNILLEILMWTGVISLSLLLGAAMHAWYSDSDKSNTNPEAVKAYRIEQPSRIKLEEDYLDYGVRISIVNIDGCDWISVTLRGSSQMKFIHSLACKNKNHVNLYPFGIQWRDSK